MWEYFAAGLIVFVLIALVCCGNREDDRIPSNVMNNLFPVDIESNEPTPVEKEERRFIILTHVITKKVKANVLPHEDELSVRSAGLSNRSTKVPQEIKIINEQVLPKQKSDIPEVIETGEENHNTLERSNLMEDIPEEENNNTDEMDTITEREKEKSFDRRKSFRNYRRSLAHSSSSLYSRKSLDDESSNKVVTDKDNFMIEPLKSFRLSRRSLAHSTSSIYSSKECPICLETYKENDEICWSRNRNCTHAFHLDCMVDWLMIHDDCPLCRSNYLEVDNPGTT